MEEKYIQYIKGFKYLDKDLTDEIKDNIVEEINDSLEQDIESFQEIEEDGVTCWDDEDISFEFVIENNRIVGFATDLDFLS